MYGNLFLFFVYTYSIYSIVCLIQNILLHKGFVYYRMGFLNMIDIKKNSIMRMISIIQNMVSIIRGNTSLKLIIQKYHLWL